ncbi:Linoleate 10R-lipoxygenase COP4 [Rhizoctonia solani]|uniref:Terpene synthase n=1 Tax=Rhizoctonia solani TaxID=456999 RepID=A0A0K6G2K1_9AGAM|nr:Linoleate 10R-lipoxygenase COP4 [Rhizoctonia solani]
MAVPLPLPLRCNIPNIAAYTREFFASKCNPYHPEAESGARAWFDSYGIYSDKKREKFFDSQFCLLASLLYPNADLEHVRPAMDFILWLFSVRIYKLLELWEFSTGGLRLAVDVTMNAIRNPDSGVSGVTIAATVQSVVNRMRVNGSHATIDRLIDALQSYSQSIIKENSNKADGYVETIEEYTRSHLDTSGVKLTLAMLEYAHCLDVPEEVHSDPIVAELATAGNEIISWANDIYSFPVEQSWGQLHNFVYVVMKNKKLELQGAIDYVN